ncbi:MAG: hypothetical protein ACHQDC_07350, partial [Acidimicrobiales bacterium]
AETAIEFVAGRPVDTLGAAASLIGRCRADVKVVIDVDALHLHAPEIITDLPAGGRRLVQRVDGYRWTVQSGRITFENGQATGARPGKVIRRESSNGG